MRKKFYKLQRRLEDYEVTNDLLAVKLKITAPTLRARFKGTQGWKYSETSFQRVRQLSMADGERGKRERVLISVGSFITFTESSGGTIIRGRPRSTMNEQNKTLLRTAIGFSDDREREAAGLASDPSSDEHSEKISLLFI